MTKAVYRKEHYPNYKQKFCSSNTPPAKLNPEHSNRLQKAFLTVHTEVCQCMQHLQHVHAFQYWQLVSLPPSEHGCTTRH